MNYIRQSLFIAAAALSLSIPGRAQTADDIIQKHLTAVGGEDGWKKVNTIKFAGTMNAGGQEMPVTVWVSSGKGYKTEFTANGMSNYIIVTPKTGWTYFPIGGQQKPDVLPEEQVKEEQNELDASLDGLIDYKGKGNKVTYLGKDDIEGTECYKLKIIYPGGKEETAFLDASNYYLIRTVEKTKANGKEAESITNYTNYKKQDNGLMYPMSVESDGAPVTFKTVEFNVPMGDDVFKPAEGKK